jgi:hypothetical protein
MDMPVTLQKNWYLHDKRERQKKVPETAEVEFVKNVPQFIKNEFGGYFLVHNGYKYIKWQNPRGLRVNIWICEKGNDEKIKCSGKVLLNEFNQIEVKESHNHKIPQLTADMAISLTYKDPLSPENVKQLKEGKQIYHDGFTYRAENYRNLKVYYVCKMMHKCKGRAIVYVGKNVIVVTVQHNHKGEKLTSGISFLII